MGTAAPMQRRRFLQHLVGAALATPQALAVYHKAEIEKWWPIIKAANIKPQ